MWIPLNKKTLKYLLSFKVMCQNIKSFYCLNNMCPLNIGTLQLTQPQKEKMVVQQALISVKGYALD